MSLKLIAPGKRGNKFYYLRGTVGGQRVESTTGTTNKDAAEKFRAEFELKLLTQSGKRVILTYGEASDLYLEKRDLPKWELKHYQRIKNELGETGLDDMSQADIIRVADLLYPGAPASTRNRWVIMPIAAIVHYAARNKHCAWLRIEKFKETKPQTRAVSEGIAKRIIEASAQQDRKSKFKNLLCIWLFKHGNRITETLRVLGANIDIKGKTFQMLVSKSKIWKTFALDPEVIAALRDTFPDGLPDGHIFPWRTRWGVYKWLTPMREEMGIKFTPHMARHSVGTWYNRKGANLRATMDRLGHDDVESSMRYQAGDIQVVRAFNRKIGNLSGGRKGGKRKKT